MHETIPKGRKVAVSRVLSLAVLLTLALAMPGAAEPASAPDVLVTPGFATFQHPQIAVQPNDPDRIVIAYHEGQNHAFCGLARSADGGRTWANERVVGDGTPYPMPATYDQCYDPMVAYGPDGTLYYEYSGYPGTNQLSQRVNLITASRGGGRFETPRDVAPEGSGVDRSDLYAEMAVDARSGRVYVSWMRYCEQSVPSSPELTKCGNPGAFQVTSSADGARTFSPPVRVSPPTSPNPGRSSLAVDAGGTLYAAWIDGFLASPTPPSLFVSSSKDQGKTFAPAKEIAKVNRCSGDLCYSGDAGSGGFFQMVAGPTGEISIVWWDKQDGKQRLFFTATRDAGATWTEPKVIGIPPGGQDHEQHHPRLARSPGGRLAVLYYDYRPDGFHDVYLTESTDGGTTFATPHKLNDAPSNAKVGPSGGALANFAQRIGLTYVGERPIAAWTDSRRGTKVSGKHDIYFEGGGAEMGQAQGPVISAFKVSPRVLVRSRPARVRGVSFRYRLSKPAAVRFSFDRARPGRRVGRSCRKPTRAQRGRKSCVRFVLAGTVSRRGAEGPNRMRFSGKAGKRRLRPGAYRVSVVATDAGGRRSAARHARLTVRSR
jgi:hypothetical protein